MTPPKCFFKRPEEFYSHDSSMLQSPKIECYSMPSSPVNNAMNNQSSMLHLIKTEKHLKNECLQLSRSQQSTPINSSKDQIETPLDLSCKCVDSNNNELLQMLGNFLMQQQQLARVTQTLASNPHYINLERLFSQLPQQFLPIHSAHSMPKICVTPSAISTDIDPVQTSFDRVAESRHHLTPHNMNESLRGRSSSDSSSQYTPSQYRNPNNKRKLEGKLLRPFKLYKGNDSQGLVEALGINSEDEEWLKSIVEFKSVDDIFLFLTNCMNHATKPPDLADEVVEKIKTKFGHIFQNCNSTVSNPRMIRHPDMTPRELKTDEYWEKRRKNNDAAKRSRETRRHKEDNLNQHCEKLQSENDCLRKEIERVKIRIDDIKRSIG